MSIAYGIRRALGIRKTGAEIISCPTCGRCQIDLEGLPEKSPMHWPAGKIHQGSVDGLRCERLRRSGGGGYRHRRRSWFRHAFQKGAAYKRVEEKILYRHCLRKSIKWTKNNKEENALLAMHLPTGREIPSDAEVISNQLMIRAE